jgi:sugar phosphate isomerase/epimerase
MLIAIRSLLRHFDSTEASVFKNLNPGTIGIRNVGLPDALRLGAEAGFAGVDFDIREAAAMVETHGLGYVRDLFQKTGLRPGSWSLPVSWRTDDWRDDLDGLAKLAGVAAGLECPRTATWLPSWSDERPFDENFAWHRERFRPIAELLKDHGCRLGLEFIGPATLRADHAHEFIHTMDGMLELIGAIGTGNVGLLFDSWHLYTSGGQIEDIGRLSAENVVTVHVNDAPGGVPRDEQLDNVRCLPMETGVIDLPGFLRGLQSIGYDGPVTTEPFNARIRAVAAEDPGKAAREVSRAMDLMWEEAGI